MSDKPSLCCLGGGAHARVVVAAARAAGLLIKGVLAPSDPNNPALPYLGDDADYSRLLAGGEVAGFVVGLGAIDGRTAQLRADVFERLARAGGLMPAVIHPAASVAPTARISDAAVVMRGAVLGEDVCIGRNAIVNTGAVIDHDCRIGDHAHIAPGVSISGGTTIGDRALIGTGASIIQGITIGRGAVIGAGSAVIRNVEEGETVVGVPAQRLGPRT